MEPHVVLDQGLDVGVGSDGADLGIQLRHGVVVGPLRREARRVGFEQAAHREDLQQRLVVVQVDDERDRLEKELRLEARDIRAVAAAHIEHADHLERLHRFAHRAARQAETLGEVLLGGQARAGCQLAADDHVFDLRDRFVGDGHAPIIDIRCHRDRMPRPTRARGTMVACESWTDTSISGTPMS